MDNNEAVFTYSFSREEIKRLSVLFRKQRIPVELFKFSKALTEAFSRNVSLEEAEALLHE